MPITTLDGLIAGLRSPEDVWKLAFSGEIVGGYHSNFYLAGRPGAAQASVAGISGEALTTYPGQIPFPAAVAGTDVHLARMEAQAATGVGGVVLADRLWHNSALSVVSTSLQAVNSVAWPARDSNGGTDGDGVQVAIEVTTFTGSGTPVATLLYTNSEGQTGRTGSVTVSSTMNPGTFMKFALQDGDVGVRSIQSVTFSATMTSGAVSLVAFRPVVTIPTVTPNVSNDRDGIALGLPRFYDNSVPFLIYQLTSTAVGVTNCSVTWAQG